MKAGVVIDSWKLVIFKRHLDNGGFKYEQHPGIVKDSITLVVFYEDQPKLIEAMKKANIEAFNASNMA